MAKDKSLNVKQGLSVGETVTYSLGSLGREFSNNCINAFLLVYLVIYQHLDPVVMTVAFVLAKLWDAVNDPMLATLVNNAKAGRFGRYRPWILGGAIVNTISIVLLFTNLPNASEGMRYFYYIAMYILWGMSFTVMDVPFWSMLPTIANTTEERNKASSLAKLIGGFGGFLVGMLGTSFILPAFSSKGMTSAYTMLGLCAGVVMIIFVLFTVIFNREKYEVPHDNVSLKHIINMFKENDQLRAYALNLVLFLTGTTIALSQILYLYIYCYEDSANLLASAYSYTLFWIIACTGQGIAMFFYNQLTRVIPREKIYALSFLGCIISYVLMFLVFFVTQPGKYVLNAVIVALSGAFLMISSGMNQIGSTVMVADVVDYGEFKTGKRGDSVIFSVQTLIGKFAGAIAMLILGVGISVAGLPNISDVNLMHPVTGEYVKTAQVYMEDDYYLIKEGEPDENGYTTLDYMQSNPDYADRIKIIGADEELISTNSLTILRVFMFLVPIPLAILGYYVYKKKYWLFGKRYDDIKEEIDKRRAGVAPPSDSSGEDTAISEPQQ